MLNHYEVVFILTPVLSDEQMKETAEKFFSCDRVTTVTEYVGNRLAAMASLVPIYARNTSVSDMIRGYYIYGVCVDKEYRGRGLFSAIMKKAEE